jgi:hypothetical protein
MFRITIREVLWLTVVVAHQSAHHSRVLPCVSNRPKGLGRFVPTGPERPLLFFSFQA